MIVLVAALASLLFSTVLGSSAEYARDAPGKRGFRAPAHFRSPTKRHTGISRRSNGTAQSTADNGQWLISVSIGGQQALLNILTDSADLWVASTLLPKNESSTVTTTTGKLYDPSQSANYQVMDGYSFNESYADGSGASGLVATDMVDIGGAVVPNMPFGVCTSLQYGSGSTTRDTDGPLGLGFGAGSTITPNKQCTFMECLLPYVDQPIFSTAFELDSSGFIDFGYSDDSAYEGDLTVLPINNNTIDGPSLWVTPGVHFGSGGKFFNAPPTDVQYDTANPALTMPAEAASAYFALVKDSSYSSDTGLWSYPCATLPDLDIIFSNVTSGPSTVIIPGESLVNGDASSGSTCTSWIMNADGLANGGLPFYISKYMIWNQAVPSIAFARRKGVAAPKATVTRTVTSTHPEKTGSASTSSGLKTSSGAGSTSKGQPSQTAAPNKAGSVSVATQAGIGIGVAVWALLFVGL